MHHIGHRLPFKAVLAGLGIWAFSAAGAAAQTAPFNFTPGPDGFTLTIPGISDAGAISGAIQGAAEAGLLSTQSLVGNTVTEPAVNVSVGFEQSGIGDQGIVDVNQDAGTLNNQANIRAIAIVLDGQQFQGFNFDTQQLTLQNNLTVTGGNREDHITDSFANTTGIVGINQSAGSLNQQTNALLLVIGATMGPDVMTVGDSTLSTLTSLNTLTASGGGDRTDTLSNSFANFQGIAQVSQSAGDLNQIANRIAISVTMVSVP